MREGPAGQKVEAPARARAFEGGQPNGCATPLRGDGTRRWRECSERRILAAIRPNLRKIAETVADLAEAGAGWDRKDVLISLF
jgi:hypothetical protein